MTDQFRGDCLGIAGHPDVQTPRLDNIARRGFHFHRAYSACPVCMPARRTLMSGKKPSSHGVLRNYNTCLEGPTLPEELSKAGYQTHLCGKLHLCPERKLYGFDSSDWADWPVSNRPFLKHKGLDDYERFLFENGINPREASAHGICFFGLGQQWEMGIEDITATCRNISDNNIQIFPAPELPANYYLGNAGECLGHACILGELDEQTYLRSKEISAGEKLGEDAISATMKVSRTPVREAVHRLTLEGMVKRIPRCGCFVKEQNYNQLKEIFECRQLLECQALSAGFAAIISLIGGPFLGKFIGEMVGLTGLFALGLVVMSAAPPTLSSGIVITEAANGNRLWAVFLTVGLNLLGILTIPLMLKLTLHENENIYLSPWPLFIKLLLYVLVPLVMGVMIRRFTPKYNFSNSLKYIPSACVILTVWVALSASRKLLVDVPGIQYLYMAVAGLTVHGVLLILNGAGGKYLLRLKSSENKALVFVASQKTLPISISVLPALGDNTALAILTCMVFHFGQLLVDSFISARMR